MKFVNFGSIEDHIGFQVHLTWRAIKKKLLSAGGPSDERVSLGAYSIPILVGLNPGISPQALAKALHLDASKVAFFLKTLEREGIVTRSPSEKDKRKVEVNLTDRGVEFSKEATSSSRKMENPISSTITEEEGAELIRILMKIQNNI